MRTPLASRLWWVAWLLAAGLLALIPLLAIARPGLPNTADGYVHLLRALEATELVRAGHLYPRWAPDFYLGYGYPFFNFYAAGAHLLTAALALAGTGVLRGLVAVQVLALLLYPTGAFLAARALLRPHGSRIAVATASLAAAAAYLYAPLRFRELFTQGNVSQLLALGWLPWAAWLLIEALRRDSGRWTAAAGVALAGLVYAHHPSAFLGFPALAAFAAWLAVIEGRGLRARATWRGIALAAAAFGIGVALSAPFWLPATLEMRYVGIRGIEAGMFNARQNLVPLRELLAPAAVLDDTALNPPQPISLGSLQVILAAGGLIAAAVWLVGPSMPRSSKGPRKKLPTVVLSSPCREQHVARQEHAREWSRGLSRLLSLSVKPPEGSIPLRRHVPGSGLTTQIAWRGVSSEASGPMPQKASFGASGSVSRNEILGWTLLGTAALLIACLALILPEAGPLWVRLPLARLIAFPWRLLGPALLFAAFLAAGAVLALPPRLRNAALLALLVLAPLSVAPYLFPRPFAPAAEPTLADIVRYEQSGGARATASANEYLPAWVQDPDPPAVLAEAYLAGARPDRLDRSTLPTGSQVTRLTAEPLGDVYRLSLPTTTTVRFYRFFFPGWRAAVDGRPAVIEPDPRYGQIQVVVPAGTHEVAIRFGTTPARTAGWLLAALGLAAVLLALTRGGQPRDESQDLELQPPSRGGIAWLAIAVILVITGLKVLWVEPATRWFRLRSPVEAPAAMQHPVHTQFANGIALIGYDMQRATVRQGGKLWVRLYWRTLQPLGRDFSPFLHLDAPTGEVTWANRTKLHAGDKPSRDWPVEFYVVDEYWLTVPEETPAVLAALRAGWLDGAGQVVPTAQGQSAATITQVRVTERRPLTATAVPGGPAYQLGPVIRLLGHTAVLTGTQAAPQLDLTLYWQANAAVTEDYTVFVHVLQADNTKAAQGDGPPVNGWYPTSNWAPGQVVVDQRTIPLPDTAPTAEGLTVAVGLYRLGDGSRLPVTTAAGERVPDDQIILPVAPLP